MLRFSLRRALLRVARPSKRRASTAAACWLESLEPRQVLSSVSALHQVNAVTDTVSRSSGATARIINGSVTATYPAVGLIGADGQDYGSGVLIASQYVLTAGHCAEGVADNAGQFTVGDKTYHTEKIYLHPNYNGDVLGSDIANDIAIFRLDEPVTGIAPLPISRVAPRVGQALTLVGFGGGGTGATGGDGGFGTKRIGVTPIDRVTSKLIHWTFDDETESNTAPGDSGGPAFLTVNGVKYIAGITSGGSSETSGIGDHSFDTRVDVYASWIDGVVNSPPPPPTISIVAIDANAAETLVDQEANPATVTLTRTGSTSAALTVAFSISGTASNGSDNQRLPTTVTFPAGQSTVSLNLTPIDDTAQEWNETVKLTLTKSAKYKIEGQKSNATVNIADNDRALPVISVVATDAVAAETRGKETPDRGQFTITRTGTTTAALTVSMTVSGSSTNGRDGAKIGNSVTIPAGRSSVTVNVSPTDDSESEPQETVILTLNYGATYNVEGASSSATVTINDNDSTVSLNDDFANRAVIAGSVATVIGNNRFATKESNEPNPGGTSGIRSLWWTWTAPTSGSVTVRTTGSNFDTTLGVYSGQNLDSLLLVAENDDENYNAGVSTSVVTFNAVAGTTYQILVNGYRGDSGDITLKIDQQLAALKTK